MQWFSCDFVSNKMFVAMIHVWMLVVQKYCIFSISNVKMYFKKSFEVNDGVSEDLWPEVTVKENPSNLKCSHYTVVGARPVLR